MPLPSLIRDHGLTTVQIVGGSIVQDEECLFFTVPQCRNTRHDQVGDELTELLSLCTICQTGPSEHILITRSKHVSRVKFVGLRIQEFIGHNHFVPCSDKVDIDIVSHVQVSVHTQESTKRSVDRVVESCRIETCIPFITQEILALVLSHVDGICKVVRKQ